MLFHPIAAFAALLILLVTAPAGAADTILKARCIGCDMHGQDLRGRDLHGATYIGADLRNVDLRDADLHDAKFIGVDLSGARLDGSDLRGVAFTGTDFGNATLSDSQVSGVRITGADLKHVQLAGVKVYQLLARCIGCDFARADLHGMDMHGTALIGADFHDANLEKVNFNGATLCSGNDRKSCIELRGARIGGADFRNVRWCRELDRICRPVTADELRRFTHNALDGALLP
jgi:uncharacterized protein YjbI with pentapeptide repeats